MSGVKGENTVKVVGPDLRVNEAKANEIVDVMSTVKGVAGPGRSSRRSASPTSASRPTARSAAATASTSATSRRWCRRPSAARRSPRSTRARSASTSPSAGRRRTARTSKAIREHPGGHARRRAGAARPDRADRRGGGPVAHLPRGQPPLRAGEVLGARPRPGLDHRRGAASKIAEKVKLPYDTHLEWAGEINQLNEATGRLALIIPLTLLVIAMLVYSSVKNWKDMLIVLAASRSPAPAASWRCSSRARTSRSRRRWGSSRSSASRSRTR